MSELHDLLLELDARVRRLEELPQPQLRDEVMTVLQIVDRVHRPGIARLAELLREAGLWEKALADEELYILFGLYDLAELGREEPLVQLRPLPPAP